MHTWASTLDNPLNTALVFPILWLLYRVLFPSWPQKSPKATTHEDGAYNWAPPTHPKVRVFKQYTVYDLEPFNGKAPGSTILLAIARIGLNGRIAERTVFDVTTGANFYGPEGMYGNFAGRDASRGMAKQSFDEDMLTPLDEPLDPLTDLSRAEIENMHGWHQHFSGKYPTIGALVEESQKDK